MAAALAFYTLISTTPLLILALSISRRLYEPGEAQARVLRGIETILGPEAAALLQALLRGTTPQGASWTATVVSIAVVAYGATRVFGELQSSLRVVWRNPDREPEGFHPVMWLRAHLFTFLLVLGAGLLWMAGIVGSTVLSAIDSWMSDRIQVPLGLRLAGLIHPIASVALLTLALAVLYRFFSEGRAGWRDVWLGALLTAVLIAAGQKLIGLYLGNRGVRSVYGAAGSLVLVLFWYYYTWMTFLLGAELTKVWVTRFRRRARVSAS